MQSLSWHRFVHRPDVDVSGHRGLADQAPARLAAGEGSGGTGTPLPRHPLEESLGLLQLASSPGRQTTSGPVDEELDHADRGTEAPGAHPLARHHPGDGLGVLRVKPLRRVGRHCLHRVAPPPLRAGCYAALRVAAAFRAAACRPARPFVATALRAEASRAAAPRCRAACRAWRARASLDADRRPSRLRAPEIARERVCEGLRWRRAAREAYAALFRVLAFVPAGGGPSLTPARRALLKPIATACFGERAPCLPPRMGCISSRMNSPACVVGRLSSRRARRARSRGLCSGMGYLLQTVAHCRAALSRQPWNAAGVPAAQALFRSACPRRALG
jgi:hypothetical protein